MKKLENSALSTTTTTSNNVNSNSIYKPIVRCFLYIFLGGADGTTPLYIGQTSDIQKRKAQHLCGHSHLGIIHQEWYQKYNLTNILYFEITDIVQEKAEVLHLEQMLMDYFDPIFNQNINKSFEFLIDEERSELLEYIFYDELVNLNYYKCCNVNRDRLYSKYCK